MADGIKVPVVGNWGSGLPLGTFEDGSISVVAGTDWQMRSTCMAVKVGVHLVALRWLTKCLMFGISSSLVDISVAVHENEDLLIMSCCKVLRWCAQACNAVV